MIKMLRLDERLIHGQIAIKWSKLLQVDRIIVADDLSASSDVVKKSLMMAAPTTCKTLITTMDKAIELCNDSRAKNLKILFIVSNPINLLRVVNEVEDIQKINIGNYGRIAKKHNDCVRTRYSSNVYLYDDEKKILEQVLEKNSKVEVQTIPDDVPQTLNSILGKGGN